MTKKKTATNSLSSYKMWWSNGNTYTVKQGSPMYPFITVKKSLKLQAIRTYHWNNGQGATPGKIALMKFDPADANADGTFDTKKGTVLGPWNASGLDNNRYWVVYPGITLSSGCYCIIDLEPSTWSYNSSSKNEGFAEIYGVEGGDTIVTATPKPTAAVIKTPTPTTTVKTPAPTSKATKTPVPTAAAKTPAPSGTPKTTLTPAGTPLPTLSPSEDNTETFTEHTSQSDGTVPTPTEAPIGKKVDIGVKTSVSYTSGDVSSGAKKTASVTVKKPTARLGDISVDYGELNLEEDQTVKMTLSTLSEKKDKKNGYSVKAWNLDTGSSEEYVLPVIVTIPYDSSVTDPYQELNYASDLGKLLNFIMKKYPENPDKWLPKFNAAIEGQSRWLRKFNQEELNALYYAFTGEASEVGYRYAEQNIGEEQILYELKNTVKQSRLFLNFADKCREQLDRVDQENWRIYQRQMNRKLLFKLQDQDGKEVAFKDMDAYKDKYIFLEMEDGTWTIWQPKTKSTDQKGSTTSTIAESTYFGFTQLGGKVKTGTSDGINELSVYESLEDYTKNKKLETITFTGPGETSPSGSSEEETVIIKLDAMSLNKSELTLNVNETFQLQLNGADASKVTWSVDDTAAGVADVSKTGLVTAKKTGKVKVIAQYNGKKFICVVEVQTKREFKGTYKGTLTRGEKTYSCTVTVSDSPNYDGSYLAMISAEGIGHIRDADMVLDTSGENIVCDSTFRTYSQHFKCDGKTFTFEYSDPDHIYSSTFTTQSAYCTK